MNLINHEVLGEGYYFLDEDEILFVDKTKKKLAKQQCKKLVQLTQETLDINIEILLDKLIKASKETTITINGSEKITNILYLWYKDGFCHYKTFICGEINFETISLPLRVNRCEEKIDNYLTIQKPSYFGEWNFNSKTIYDNDLKKLYKMYKEK